MKILITLLMTSLIGSCFAQDFSKLEAPKNKKEVKAYYMAIDQEAKKLKTVPDDQLVARLLQACVKARALDPNIFCLESIVDFYRQFPQTVERVAKLELSKDNSDFVLERLHILIEEAGQGNDPSVP